MATLTTEGQKKATELGYAAPDALEIEALNKEGGTGTIPVSNLMTSVNPVVVPPPQPQVDTTALSGLNTDFGSSIIPKPKDEKNETLDFLKQSLESDETARMSLEREQQGGEFLARADAEAKASADLSNLDKSYQDQIKAIRETTSGMTREQQQGALSEAQYNYENRRANLSIAYNTAAGRLKNVQDAIQLKTKALDDRWNRNIQSYQLMADAIQNDLTESEKLIVQANLSKKQADANAIRDTYSSVLAQVAQNGAPSYILDAIDAAASKPNATEADIRNAAGSYGVDRLQQAQLAKAQRDASGGLIGGISETTQAIIENPSLFDDLTATEKGKVITQLQANGYDTSNLGLKGLDSTAITTIAQSQKALADLDELRGIMEGNEEFIGPISGFARLNPYSKARQIQADVDRVRQTVGKALEGGVLRKEDEEKYKKILATLSDTPETAIYKIDALKSSIARDIENYKSLQQSSGKSLDVGASLQQKGQTEEDLRTKYNY
jgi:hypothetical protein